MSEAVKGRAWDGSRANFDFDRNLAVIIGIDRYENDSIRNLSTAVSDAGAIADLLEQEYAYKQSDEQPKVIRLFDEAATLQGLRDLFTQTLPEQKLTEGDRLIVYFAGHGLPRSNEDGPEGYLVPYNADPTKPDSFLAMREVSDALGNLGCHHLLVILDCCFAGTFRWAGSRKVVPILETIRREHYYHFIRHPAWQVITSSAHDQEALDVARLKEDNRQPVSGLNKPHSPFALALLEGLQPGDDPQRVKADLYPDGVVTAHELFVYLQSRVKALSGEQQAPGIYPLRRDYDKGEFIFTPPGFDPQKLAEALPLNEENNPYRGLKSFDEKHARFFFGRQALIEELAKRLAQPNQALTVVLGVSGSGKSSLVKAGLIPHLRNQQTEQEINQWRILDPMRPGELPFTSLARILLPIANSSLLEQLAQVSFLDDILQPTLKPKSGSARDSDKAIASEQEGDFLATQPSLQADETLIKVADFWCSATSEAKLLLIEDYFAQLETLVNSQQQEQLKRLYDQILAELSAVSQNLQEDPQYFSRAIATWSQQHPDIRLLLVIDQFEELLTRSQDDRESPNPTEQQDGVHGVSLKENRPTEQKEWQKFLEVLRTAIADHPQTLRLLLTLRSDFEPRFLSSALEPYWKDARFPVRAMTSDELRQAIENPALKQALYFEELKDEKGNTIGNLVSKLVDEVGQMPGALPLLSFTLSELYVSLYRRWQNDRSTDRTLRFADYEALGGVTGALTRRATEEYEALDENHRATMRRMMLRMVTIEGGGVARRRVPESELVYPSSEENERVRLAIDRLVKVRLLVKGQETGEPYVEPAHDFLVSGWNKLQEWVKENQEDVTLQQRLNAAANDWKNSRGMLWVEEVERLAKLEKVLELEMGNWMNTLEIEFVRCSLRERQDRIRKLEEDLKISEQRRVRSELREKVAESEVLRGSKNLESLCIAIQAIGQNLDELPTELLGLVRFHLQKTAQSISLKNIFYEHQGGVVTDVAFSPDDQLIVSSDFNGRVRVRNLQGKIIGGISIEDKIIYIGFLNENKTIIIGGRSTTMHLWDFQNNSLTEVELDVSPYRNRPKTIINCMDYSHKFELIVTGTNDGAICLHTLDGKLVGKPYYVQESVESVKFNPMHKNFIAILRTVDVFRGILHGKPVKGFSRDFSYLLKSSRVLINKLMTPLINLLATSALTEAYNNPDTEIWTNCYFPTPTKFTKRNRDAFPYIMYVKPIAFSADGKLFVLSCINGVRLFPPHRNEQIQLAESAMNDTLGAGPIVYSPDNNLIAIGIGERIKILDSQLLKKFRHVRAVKEIKSHEGTVVSLAFSADSKRLVSGSSDGTVRLWDSSPSVNLEIKSSTGSQNISPLAVSASRGVFACIVDKQLIEKFNFEAKPVERPLSRNQVLQPKLGKSWNSQREFETRNVVFSSDGKLIAGIDDMTIVPYVWDAADNLISGMAWDPEINPLEMPSGDEVEVIASIAISIDNQLIASGCTSGSIRLWSTFGSLVHPPFKHGSKTIRAIAFSPDGRFIASGSDDGTIQLWNIEGHPVGKLFANSEVGIKAITFSPNSQLIASGSEDGTVQLWDLKGNAVRQPFLGHKYPITSLEFSPQGDTILSCDRHEANLWKLDGSRDGHFPSTSATAFSLDGKRIIAISCLGEPNFFSITWEEPLEQCCKQLRNYLSATQGLEQPDKVRSACAVCQKYVWSKLE